MKILTSLFFRKMSGIVLLLLTFKTISFAQSSIVTHYKFSDDIEKAIEQDSFPSKYQIGAMNYAICGYYRDALRTWDANSPGKIPRYDSTIVSFFEHCKKIDARKYILKLSRKERIIIINEAHHHARHRNFTASLLKGLYKNGFRYLGLEALWVDTLINRRHFVSFDDGVYVRDPEFGNLIHEATRIGFTVFGYEATDIQNSQDREEKQARNIMDFLNRNPPGKVLIFCGYAHAYENEYKPWGKAMAGRLKEYMGIDVFTIDQTKYSEKHSPQANPIFVNLVEGDFPVVLMDTQGRPFNGLSDNNQTDVVIIYPKTNYIEGKPIWQTYHRKPHAIKLRDVEMPVLALAYRKGEYEKKGVPADIVEIKSRRDDKTIFLSPGEYEIVLQNERNEVIETYSIAID
ncbi:hypothetical protein [uncultured Alistipes sp.]|uniref:hypothetical protein n=1 Tax=uncultured Alistipes sp. TaxID=538949 RepID=UPI00261F6162|nr:hypothetical protein [uncultured Alistipes sp.]